MLTEFYTSDNGVTLDVYLVKCIPSHNRENLIILSRNDQVHRTCCLVYSLSLPSLNSQQIVPECSMFESSSHMNPSPKSSYSSKTTQWLSLYDQQTDWGFRFSSWSCIGLLLHPRMKQTHIFMKSKPIIFHPVVLIFIISVSIVHLLVIWFGVLLVIILVWTFLKECILLWFISSPSPNLKLKCFYLLLRPLSIHCKAYVLQDRKEKIEK